MTEATWTLCAFGELTAGTLYEILALRAEVFVVEQNCTYLDPDDKDQRAYHLLSYVKGELAAYSRIFAPGDYFDECSIGRVVVSPRHRGKSLGRELMERSIAAAGQLWPGQPITISGQLYLEKFYCSLGFATVSDPYPEDGIPHVRMRRK